MRCAGSTWRLYQLSRSTESTQNSCSWPALILPASGRDHAAVFKLVEAAAGGGKDEDRQPRVAKDEQFHCAAEMARMPFVIFAVHVSWVVGRSPL